MNETLDEPHSRSRPRRCHRHRRRAAGRRAGIARHHPDTMLVMANAPAVLSRYLALSDAGVTILDEPPVGYDSDVLDQPRRLLRATRSHREQQQGVAGRRARPARLPPHPARPHEGPQPSLGERRRTSWLWPHGCVTDEVRTQPVRGNAGERGDVVSGVMIGPYRVLSTPSPSTGRPRGAGRLRGRAGHHDNPKPSVRTPRNSPDPSVALAVPGNAWPPLRSACAARSHHEREQRTVSDPATRCQGSQRRATRARGARGERRPRRRVPPRQRDAHLGGARSHADGLALRQWDRCLPAAPVDHRGLGGAPGQCCRSSGIEPAANCRCQRAHATQHAP
jgi:hypothetical protein